MRMCHFIIFGLQYFSTLLPHKRGTIFEGKKVIEHKMRVFDVITSFLSGCIVGVGRVRTVTRAPLRVTSLVGRYFDLSHTFPAL